MTEKNAKRPNILVIWGDDVGMWNISAYHRGMMGGSTPNIDRIANEGMIFMDHYAEASCTAGRAAFITGQYPIRVGLATVGLVLVGETGTGRLLVGVDPLLRRHVWIHEVPPGTPAIEASRRDVSRPGRLY